MDACVPILKLFLIANPKQTRSALSIGLTRFMFHLRQSFEISGSLKSATLSSKSSLPAGLIFANPRSEELGAALIFNSYDPEDEISEGWDDDSWNKSSSDLDDVVYIG